MQSMQARVLDALSQAITELKLEPVINTEWANTGTVFGMDGLATLIRITYGFQDSYCTLTFSVPGLDMEQAGLRDGGPEGGPSYRVERNELTFHRLDFTDGTRLQGAVRLVRELVEAFHYQVNGDGT